MIGYGRQVSEVTITRDKDGTYRVTVYDAAQGETARSGVAQVTRGIKRVEDAERIAEPWQRELTERRGVIYYDGDGRARGARGQVL